MADIMQYTDYTSPFTTAPLLYSDGAIDPGSLCVADFLDPLGWANGVLPPAPIVANTLAVNFVDGADSLGLGTVGASQPIGNTGYLISDASTKITLPASCKLGAGALHFGFGLWIKPGTQTSSGSTQLSLCGCAPDNLGANRQWLMSCSANSPTSIIGSVGGSTCTVAISATLPTQIFFEAVLSGGSVTVYGYVNGVLTVTGSTYAFSGGLLPVPATAPAIGPISSYAHYVGEVGRFLFEDFSVSGAQTAAAFVANDYALNNGRFS